MGILSRPSISHDEFPKNYLGKRRCTFDDEVFDTRSRAIPTGTICQEIIVDSGENQRWSLPRREWDSRNVYRPRRGDSYGVVLSVPYDQMTELEIRFSNQATNFSGGGSAVDGVGIDIEYWHVGGAYLLPC